MQGLLDGPEILASLPGHELLPYQEMLDPDGGILLLETPQMQQSFLHTPTLALGCAWQVTPRNIEPLDIGACLDLARLHAHMVTSLPVGSALQTLTTILPAHEVPAWDAQRVTCAEDALLTAQREAIRKGLPHTEARGIGQLRTFHTLLTLRIPLQDVAPSILAQFRAVLTVSAHEVGTFAARVQAVVADQWRDFETARRGIDDSLRAAGHEAHRLDGPALSHAIAQALAPDQCDTTPVLTWDEPLRTQVLTRSMHQTLAGGFRFAAEGTALHSQMVSLHHPPPQTYPGMLCATRAPEGVEPLAVWQSWAGPITIAVNMAVMEQRTEETGRKVKRWFAERNQKTSVENAAMATELKGLETQFFTHGGQMYTGRVHIALWGEAESLPAGLAALKRRGSFVQLPLEVETGAIGSTLWLQTLPLNFDPAWPSEHVLQRAQKLPLTHLVNLCTLYGCWQGTKTASVLLLNSRGESAAFDVFNNLTNAHMLIAGTSGAGKTYTLGHMINQVMAQGATLLLLEPLGNFRHLCAAHEGTYLRLTYDDPPCFNPFYGPRTEDHQSFMTGFWAECASGGVDPLSWEEFNVLGSAVSYQCYAWDDGRGELTLSPFVEEVLHDGKFALNDAEARRIGQQLARKLLMFYGTRPYAKFVDGPNRFQITPGLTVVELSEFKKAPALQAMLFSALVHLATLLFEAPAYRYIAKYLLADEIWRWLTDPRNAAIIAAIMRTYRNLYASAWFVSQRLEDFNTVNGKVILDLAETKLFLKHPSSQYAAVKTLFELTDAEMHLVSHATKHDDWSSGFLRLDSGEGGMVRIVSDRFTRLLMSQDLTIARRREQLTAQYDGKMRQAVAHMMAEGLAA